MNQPLFHGLNIYYGANFSASNVTALPQSNTHNITSDVTKVQDARNNAVARANSNPGESIAFKYYSFDSNAPSGSGAIGWIDTGIMFSVTGTSGCGPVTGSNWICDSINFDYANNAFAEATINATRNPAITS